MGKQRGGFSLVEVLVCLGLLGLLAGLTPLLMPSGPSRAGVRAAAETVAQALRAAQAKAILAQVPVALCIPTQDGQLGGSRYYYLLEGFTNPRVSEVRSLEDYHQTLLACPSWNWPGTTFSSDKSSFDVNQWASPYPHDYALIFLPSGVVVSNGLPKANNTYHLIVAQGLALQGGGASPGPPSFQASAASQACTIAVSNTGQVAVEAGLTGALSLPQGGSIPVGALAPPLSPAPQQSPTISAIVIGPSSKDMTLPPNIQAMLQRDEFLTLTVKAKSPEGVPLFCSWTSSGGAFSHPGEKPMTWDASEQVWVSTWQWAPGPEEAKLDYVADCVVRDAWNHTAPSAINSQILLRVQPRKQRVLAIALAAAGVELCTAFADGTGQKTITDRGPTRDYNSSISPDGTKLASLATKQGQDIIVIRDIEGGVLKEISSIGSPDPKSPPCWSPDGVRLSYVSGGDIWILNADGTNRINLTNSPAIDALALGNAGHGQMDPACLDDAVWSPDGKSVLYHRGLGGGQNILTLASIDGTISRNLTPPGRWRNVTFSPNGDKIVFDDNLGGSGLSMVDPDGQNLMKVGKTATDFNPRFSPDGTKFCYTVGLLGPLMVAPTADPTNPTRVNIRVGSLPDPYGEDRAFWPIWIDDDTISYLRGNGGSSARIMTIPLGGGKPDMILPVAGLQGGNNIHIAGWTK